MAGALIISSRRTALAVTLCLALGACPSNHPKASPTAVSLPPLPSAPAAGEIRVAYPWEPATLNPFVRGGDAPATRELVRELFPPLYRALPGGKSEAWLVDKVVSEMPRSVRLQLRTDARWSDGQPLTASDVRFTWQTIMDRRWPISSRAGYDAISGIDVISPHEMQINFSRDYPGWQDLFSAGLGVLPEHSLTGKDFASALDAAWPVSGGPYVLSGYTRGLEMILDANPNAWRVHPRVKRIRIEFVADPTTAVQLYRAGKIDVIGPYSSGDLIARLRAEKGLDVSTDTGATWEGLVLNTTAGILADVRVREAIARATDRNSYVAGLVRGEGERLTAPFAEPRVSIPDTGVNQARASSLLDAAGYQSIRGGVRYRGATSLGLSIASPGNDEIVARLVRAMYYPLRNAGFDLNLVDLEYQQLWRDWLPSNRMEGAVVRFVDASGGDLVARYASTQAYPAGAGYARLKSTVVDGSLGNPDRAAVTIQGAYPVIPLYRATVAAAERKGVTGVTANAAADGFLVNADEWSLAS